MKPRLLDLFCGAGGAAVGYHRAGFDVVGVDNRPQPHYPFEFVQAEALAAETWIEIDYFDAIHASPPCQAFTRYRNRPGHVGEAQDLVAPTRALLKESGLPYIIENVEGAPLHDPTLLCGSMFGLPLRRHRLFETNWALMAPKCQHGWQLGLRLYPQATNRKNARNTVEIGTWRIPENVQKDAMEIDWMRMRTADGKNRFRSELSQAIPPAYTELIGHQLLQHIKAAAA
jgi:DNA (cytosine-5)-methyltransferase 1